MLVGVGDSRLMSARHLCEPDHQFAILNGAASSEKLHIFHVSPLVIRPLELPVNCVLAHPNVT